MNLERIEDGAFCGISRLSTLKLDLNKLTSLPQLCSLKCCLVNLHIEENKLSRINKDLFEGFKKLQIVNLNDNNLLVLPDLHWIEHSVSRLTASRNKLQSLDGLHTSGIFIRLNTISVYSNYIRDFNISLLRHIHKLDYLDLQDNKLTHIDDIRGLNIRIMNLRNNPWHCDKELSWMGEEEMGFKREIICASPTCRHGMIIADMS